MALPDAFSGYTAAFPKGSIENDVNRQATAIFEAYEEADVKVWAVMSTDALVPAGE